MMDHLVFFIKSRIHVFILLISIGSIIVIALNLRGLALILNTTNLILLGFSFQLMVILSTIFVILMLPTYPFFFIIVKEKGFKFLEKISLTIILNLSFYILTGYIGHFLKIPLTGAYFLSVSVLMYLCFIIYILIIEFRSKNYFFIRQLKGSEAREVLDKKICYFQMIKKIIKENINTILLLIFLFSISVLYTVKFDFFFGRDAWFHIYLTRVIINYNLLPLNQYFGAVGLQLFGAIIHFFSGIDTIFIPRYFLFYTFFISALIFYNILMRIFRNKTLALFGVFILETSSVGFSYTMYQFWPTNINSIICLTIFYLLYIRLQNFTDLERPSKKIIIKNIS